MLLKFCVSIFSRYMSESRWVRSSGGSYSVQNKKRSILKTFFEMTSISKLFTFTSFRHFSFHHEYEIFPDGWYKQSRVWKNFIRVLKRCRNEYWFIWYYFSMIQNWKKLSDEFFKNFFCYNFLWNFLLCKNRVFFFP
jgi:hypothetical protein